MINKYTKNLLVTLVSLLFVFSFVSAATLRVNPGESIQDAINTAQNNGESGDIIEVISGIYDETLIVNEDDLTIKAAEEESPVIQPTEEFTKIKRLIDIRGDGVTFEGFEIVGNGKNDLENYDGSYLAIRIEGEGITIQDNIIRDVLTGIQTTNINPDANINHILNNKVSNVAVGISLQNDENDVDGNDISAINVGFGLASFNTDWGTNSIKVNEGGYEATISGDSYNIVYLGSIQDGINAVSDGATIKVDVGTFPENININKEINLIGPNADINPNTETREQEATISGTITIESDDVTINGFTITNPTIISHTIGILSMDNSNTKILNNIISDIGDGSSGIKSSGIAIISSNEDVKNVEISNNNINTIKGGDWISGSSTSSEGIAIGWTNGDKEITNLEISNNDISDISASTKEWKIGRGAYGIMINHKSSDVIIKNNKISNLEGLWVHAIGLEGNTPNAIVENNIIDDLTDHKTPSDAIGIFYESNPAGDTIVLSGNIISNVNVPRFAYNSMETIYVDDDYSEGNSGEYIYGINAFNSINYAMIAAKEGATINVKPGIYEEELNIDKSLKLIGENAKILTPNVLTEKIPEGNSKTYQSTIYINNSEVSIEGFEIDANNFISTGRYSAILGEDSKIEITNNTISNISVGNKETFGITSFGYYTTATKNKIETFARGGIGIYSGFAFISENIITGPNDGETEITWAPNGIQLGYGAYGEIEKNEVSKCGWPGERWAGTCIMAVDTSNVTIDSNHVFDCENGISASDYPQYMKDGRNNGDKFAPYASDIKIINNILERNSYAITVENNIKNVLVKKNIISDTVYDNLDVYTYEDWGYQVKGQPESITLVENVIKNLLEDSIVIYTNLNYTLNIAKNYWGTNSPNFTKLTYGNVTSDPYYTNEDLTKLKFPITKNENDSNELNYEEELNFTQENVTVTIPKNITIKGNSSWDGTIQIPTIKTSATKAPSTAGYTTNIGKVIEIGFSGMKLEFDKAVKIVISGEANKTVGYTHGSKFTKITNVCSGNNESWNTENLAEGGECYIADVDGDLVVWTKHFTEFVTYTQTEITNTGGHTSKKSSSSTTTSQTTLDEDETSLDTNEDTTQKDDTKTINNTTETSGNIISRFINRLTSVFTGGRTTITGAVVGVKDNKLKSTGVGFIISVVLGLFIFNMLNGGLPGASHFDRAMAFHKKAAKAHDKGQYDKASKFYQKAFALREEGEAKKIGGINE
ncbi:MAG: right-handed parallel beta-helix repeat-containing protein [Candidatus Pacearchaeota archaeon]|nr:right-handed parallel beta-helix repeat-containing protein [Candidatus Pacearchaeota archaeon]